MGGAKQTPSQLILRPSPCELESWTITGLNISESHTVSPENIPSSASDVALAHVQGTTPTQLWLNWCQLFTDMLCFPFVSFCFGMIRMLIFFFFFFFFCVFVSRGCRTGDCVSGLKQSPSCLSQDVGNPAWQQQRGASKAQRTGPGTEIGVAKAQRGGKKLGKLFT